MTWGEMLAEVLALVGRPVTMNVRSGGHLVTTSHGRLVGTREVAPGRPLVEVLALDVARDVPPSSVVIVASIALDRSSYKGAERVGDTLAIGLAGVVVELAARPVMSDEP